MHNIKHYRKSSQYLDVKNVCRNYRKTKKKRFSRREMCPKGADGMANSVEPDQTAPQGTVCSGSALFAEVNHLGSLRYLSLECNCLMYNYYDYH